MELGLSAHSLARLRDRLAEALHDVALHLMRALFVHAAESLDRSVHVQVSVNLHVIAEATLAFLLGESRL